MSYQYPDPILPWLKDKTLPRHIQSQLLCWIEAHDCMVDALLAENHFRRWIMGELKTPPDVFRIIAKYGQSRAITQTWKTLPVQPAAEEAEAWREHRWGTTVREFYKEQLAVVGGFFKFAALKPEEVADVLIEQMETKLAALVSLCDEPLSYYTSETFSWDAEALLVDGDVVSREEERINRPFVLRDEMEYFIPAMEEIRMRAMADQTPELGIPSMPLFDALSRVKLHRIFAVMEEVDPKLKRILRHLDKQGQNAIAEDETAPEVIWWRHWREHEEKQRQERGDRGGGSNRRTGGNNHGRKPADQHPR